MVIGRFLCDDNFAERKPYRLSEHQEVPGFCSGLNSGTKATTPILIAKEAYLRHYSIADTGN